MQTTNSNQQNQPLEAKDLSTTSTRGNNIYFLKAKRHGFNFKEGEKQYNERTDKKDSIVESIGETPQPFKKILSFVCIGIAIILGLIEANNVSTTILGNGNFNETVAVFIGWAFACMGLVTGELLSSNLKKDEFTGKRQPTGRWYLGLALTLVYLVGQYYLASRAGIGADEMLETITTMKWFILGIAVIEILFGMAFLKTALEIFTLFIATIRIKMAFGKMKRESKHTETSWQRYEFENNSSPLQEETQAIKDARAFYDNGGFTSLPISEQL